MYLGIYITKVHSYTHTHNFVYLFGFVVERGYSLVVECLPSICEVPASIPNTDEEEGKDR